MNPQYQAFLDALTANEDDLTTRLVFADWLDENGEHEEADRMRQWPAAKKWMKEWVKSINYSIYRLDTDGNELPDENGEYTPIGKEENNPHCYADAIEAGHCAARGEGYCWSRDAGQDYFLESDSNKREWFRQWSILTGVTVPEEVVENPPYRCAC